jgi:hypothetical protein
MFWDGLKLKALSLAHANLVAMATLQNYKM